MSLSNFSAGLFLICHFNDLFVISHTVHLNISHTVHLNIDAIYDLRHSQFHKKRQSCTYNANLFFQQLN